MLTRQGRSDSADAPKRCAEPGEDVGSVGCSLKQLFCAGAVLLRGWSSPPSLCPALTVSYCLWFCRTLPGSLTLWDARCRVRGTAAPPAHRHLMAADTSALRGAALVALLLFFLGASVGFRCPETHFSCLDDFDYWERMKTLINTSPTFTLQGGSEVGTKTSPVV